jgi:hypothetical protein
MKELMTALLEANIKPETAEKALTSIEKAISFSIKEAKMEFSSEKIVPLEKDQSGIRAEIRMLSDSMKLGFQRSDEKFEKMQSEMNLHFQKMNEKMDFIRENLELQIKTSKESLEKQIVSNKESLEKQINTNRESLDKQINSNKESLDKQFQLTRENLELQIKTSKDILEAQIKSNDRQLNFQKYLLWMILAILVGAFIKSLLNT